MMHHEHEENDPSKPLSGQLSKYTNVVKGWQFRWFLLNPNHVRLEYYMQEKEEQAKQKPRGGISLVGAIVAPSEDDSVTFTVHPANGEVFRLRAESSKWRQIWVSHIMHVIQLATSRRSSTASSTELARGSTGHAWGDGPLPHHKTSLLKPLKNNRALSRSVSTPEENSALVEVKEYIQEMYSLEEDLIERVDGLPIQGSHINALDQDMLLLKACSRATLACLETCFSILEKQHAALSRQNFNKTHLQHGAKVEWIQSVKGKSLNSGDASVTSLLEQSTRRLTIQNEIGFTQSYPVPSINHDEEEADGDLGEEKDLGEIEKHKTVILHLLSQLKLGMDLTRVVLPTFILERRSLLEMFADCMAHPDIFIKVSDMSTPESRMLQVVEWYLTSFHHSRKGSLAKKPYNPIIGESFHCSWDIEVEEPSSGPFKLIYTAEQVSHHPPVSAFHVTCPQKAISLTGSLWTKSKFMGMSIGVTLVGNLKLVLPEYNEEYVMTLPSAYARSILTYPWVELGDKCTITCKKSGFSSSIVFHTKPFYGGKLNRISGEVKRPDGSLCTKLGGTWNGEIDITSAAGTKVISTEMLPIHKKKVRPIAKQGEHESRRLWQHVTNALRHNDINTATEHKTLLENRQREGERHRKEKGLSFPTRMAIGMVSTKGRQL
ncbi:oxysterol-binding protein-related protein 11-like isoform X2 [Watersipora subatra]|uniref:oxysterol-binding protein-related protein 11-like isoform X2 n=1 Tax=Watersipora subatra TaxID=2589382 RepID=UPI00355B1430